MRVIRPSSADEMVAEFLLSELKSPRWPQVAAAISLAGLTEHQIEQPNLADGIENWRRAIALGRHRGWPAAALFAGWPQHVTWQKVALGPNDLDRVLYADCAPWQGLSRDSLLVAVAARRIRENDPTLDETTTETVQSIRAVAKLILSGHSFPLMLATGPDDGDPTVLVEGHTRMTAYLLAGAPEELEIIYAAAPSEALRGWRYFPNPWPRT
jgi:hypothetical protein